MGQYWMVVNLDRKEFLHPHKLGCGLKIWEQIASSVGTGTALLLLCANQPSERGGGDLDITSNYHGPERTDFTKEGPTPEPVGNEPYSAVARRTIGRWSGDRIALIGDYANDGDLDKGNLPFPESEIYNRCFEHKDCEKESECKGEQEHFTDISDDVCAVIEHELKGRFEGKGWRDFKRNSS